MKTFVSLIFLVLCTAGTARSDIGLGSYMAATNAYSVFGQPSPELSSASASIDYVASSGALGTTTTQNNIDLGSNAHKDDPTSLKLIENGRLPIRTNSKNALFQLTMPVISVGGSTCFPIFQQASESLVFVTAYFDLSITEGINEIARFTISNALNNLGSPTLSSAILQCPAAGFGEGVISIALDGRGTAEYIATFNIGYEVDGARSFTSGVIETAGADGEPRSGTYTFTLSAVVDAVGNGGNPCGGNCGLGLGNGGGNGTANEGNGVGPS